MSPRAQETRFTNNLIVVTSVSIILLFVTMGLAHINSANYHLPAGTHTGLGGFAPFGWAGVLGGAAFIFFAYVGFDGITPAADESTRPSRNLPIAIILSLTICAILYIAVVVVLTGMVPFNRLNVANPVAYALVQNGFPWAGLIISLGVLAALSSNILVSLYGLARIGFAIARDGLLPKAFSTIHQDVAHRFALQSCLASSSHCSVRLRRSLR